MGKVSPVALGRILVICVLAVWIAPAHAQVRLEPETAQRLLLEAPDPVYPPLAKVVQLQGTVKVAITVSETGSIVSAEAVSGNPILVNSALDAVKKRKYKPYLVGGKPASFTTTVEISFSLGIPEEEYEKEQDLNKRYFEHEDRCRNLLKSEKWKDAEQVCKAAVPLADQLGDHQGLTKMGAYKHVGYALLAQRRYQEALVYYSRAFEFARLSLEETDAELGYAYRDLALANHGLGNLEKARDLYRKAEERLQLAHSRIQSEDLKKRYEQVLKQVLQYHLLAAEQAGTKTEAEEIRKRLAGPP